MDKRKIWIEFFFDFGMKLNLVVLKASARPRQSSLFVQCSYVAVAATTTIIIVRRRLRQRAIERRERREEETRRRPDQNTQTSLELPKMFH